VAFLEERDPGKDGTAFEGTQVTGVGTASGGAPARDQDTAFRELQHQSRWVLEALAGHYGPRTWYQRNEPLVELIQTILAQHTSDLNAERAFAELWKTFGGWEAIARSEVGEIEEAIRSGGLARQKAPRIKAVLQEVEARRGGFDLDFLKQVSFEEALEWLTSLNGVGPKTARCVLLFSLGFPCIPVDTHVHRVARRLALIGEKTTAEAAHRILEDAVGPEDAYRFHVYLIEHGRQVCKAPRPRCQLCPLQEACPSRVP